MKKRFRIGIALGGGAARALSHIGVIEGLKNHGIPVDIVTGTSMGAVIGAIYAAQPDVAHLKDRIHSYLDSEEFQESGFDFLKEKESQPDGGILFRMAYLARRGLFNTLAVTRTALVADEVAARSYAFLIDDIAVEQTRIPFAAAALDLRSGTPAELNRGSLRLVVTASCAMPGILNPVEINGQLLIDGGWAEAVPVQAALNLGADFVIAVEGGEGPGAFEPPRNSLDVVSRADALVRRALRQEQLKKADFVLAPRNGVHHWADFSTAKNAIEIGAREVDRFAGQIHRMIRTARVMAWLGLGRGQSKPRKPIDIPPIIESLPEPVKRGAGA